RSCCPGRTAAPPHGRAHPGSPECGGASLGPRCWPRACGGSRPGGRGSRARPRLPRLRATRFPRSPSSRRGRTQPLVRGCPPRAVVQLATAASLAAEAERVSRSRPPRDTARARPVEPPPAPPVARPPADPRVEIKSLIADYARALGSRDLAEIRRVYPALTSTEQATFSQFFESVSDLKADLTINRLIIAGGSADAFVSGVYEYRDTKTGRSRRDTTTFR